MAEFRTLRAGVFLPPFHPNDEDPLLCMERDFELMQWLDKLGYAEAYARARGVSLADCWFYTDSYSDLPVLERIGHPVVVNPDPRLRREAERRGWPVEFWGEALSGADPGASMFEGSRQES